MKRSELLSVLNTVKPALSNNDLIPVLSMFWFQGGTVMGFNDQIAIRTPLETDFVGALPGNMLLGMLNTALVETVELAAGESDASLKMGRTKLKLSYLPESDFTFFKMPKSVKNNKVVVDPSEFLTAIESCLRSIGVDVASPDQLGITIIRKGDKLHLYSTDRLTLSFAEVSTKEEPPLDEDERVILSAAFCKQMLKLLKWRTQARYVDDDADEAAPEEEAPQAKKPASAPKELVFEIGEKHALLTVGETTLYGRLIKSDSPVDFEAIYKSHTGGKVLSGMVKTPDTLDLVLSRADIITRTSTTPVATKIDVEEMADGSKRAVFHSKTPQGEVSDTLKLDKNHPEVSVDITPKLVRRGCSFFNEFVMTSKSIIFRRGKLTYLIASFRSSS